MIAGAFSHLPLHMRAGTIPIDKEKIEKQKWVLFYRVSKSLFLL